MVLLSVNGIIVATALQMLICGLCGLYSAGYYTSLWHQVDREEWVICISEAGLWCIDGSTLCHATSDVNNFDCNNYCVYLESLLPISISSVLNGPLWPTNPVENTYTCFYTSWFQLQ